MQRKMLICVVLLSLISPCGFAMEPERADYMSILPDELIHAIIAQSKSLPEALAAIISLSKTNKHFQQVFKDEGFIKHLTLLLREVFAARSKISINGIRVILKTLFNNFKFTDLPRLKLDISIDELDILIKTIATMQKKDPFFVALQLYSLQKIQLPDLSDFAPVYRIHEIDKLLKGNTINTTRFQERIVLWARKYMNENNSTEAYNKLIILYKHILSNILPQVDQNNAIILILKSGFTIDPLTMTLQDTNEVQKLEKVKALLKKGLNPNSGGHSSSLSFAARNIEYFINKIREKRFANENYSIEQFHLGMWIEIAHVLLDAGAIPTSNALKRLKEIDELKKHPGLKKKRKK